MYLCYLIIIIVVIVSKWLRQTATRLDAGVVVSSWEGFGQGLGVSGEGFGGLLGRLGEVLGGSWRPDPKMHQLRKNCYALQDAKLGPKTFQN